MKKIILQQAFEELNDAIAYYEEQQAGLGLRLKDEIERHVNWISGSPTVPRIRRGGYRRVNLKAFPCQRRSAITFLSVLPPVIKRVS